MLVSVIIPCYNLNKKLFLRCIKSVINQTYQNLEIILYEDLSTDDTASFLKSIQKEYDTRVKMYFGKTNSGPGGAKNKGLKCAKGEYILFIDSDDYIEKDYIEKLIKTIKQNSKIDIVLTNFTKIDENDKITYVRTYKNKDTAMLQKIATWGKLFKKSWLDRNKMFMPYGKVLEDVLFNSLQMLCDPVYELCDTAGYYYVYNNDSISHTTLKKFTPNSLKSGIEYLSKIKKYANTEQKREMLDYFAFKYICWHLLKSGNKVGKRAMEEEYTTAFEFLKREFPKFSKNKYIRAFKCPEERKIVHKVLWIIMIMYKLKLSKTFFKFYANHNLEKLWPNL